MLNGQGVRLQRVMQVTGHRNVPTHLAYNVPAESDLEMVRRLYDGGRKRGK